MGRRVGAEIGRKGKGKMPRGIGVTLDECAFEPTRAYIGDTGYDLYSREKVTLKSGHTAVFDTGVHISIPTGYFGKIESKSGLMVTHRVIATGGVIDSGYTGSLRVMLWNIGTEDYEFNPGDKIAQIIFLPCHWFIGEAELGDREEKGFGSSGK